MAVLPGARKTPDARGERPAVIILNPASDDQPLGSAAAMVSSGTWSSFRQTMAT
jgi:hypothetical protein